MRKSLSVARVSTKIKLVVGSLLGASFAGGFATGFFTATPTARSARRSTLVGIGVSIRFLVRVFVSVVDALGAFLESGYTRVRGREAYLEREIRELREQITRLEQRVE